MLVFHRGVHREGKFGGVQGVASQTSVSFRGELFLVSCFAVIKRESNKLSGRTARRVCVFVEGRASQPACVARKGPTRLMSSNGNNLMKH